MADMGLAGTAVSQPGGWLFQNGRFSECYDEIGACLGSGGMGRVWAARVGEGSSSSSSSSGRPAGSWVAVKAIPVEREDGERTAESNLQSGLRECLSTFRDLSPVHVVRYDSYWMEEQEHLPLEMRRFWEPKLTLPPKLLLPVAMAEEATSEAENSASGSQRSQRTGVSEVSPRFCNDDVDPSPRRENRFASDLSISSCLVFERSSSRTVATPMAQASVGFSDSCGFVWEPCTPATSSMALPGESPSSRSHYEDRLVPPPPERRVPVAGAAKEAVGVKQPSRVVLLIEMELMGAVPGRADSDPEERLTLREWLQRCDPPSRTFLHAAEVFGMLMLSVRHIHRKRLVHADLKPDNVFLVIDHSKTNKDRSGVIAVRIGDFGLAGENQLFRQFSYGVLKKSLPAGGTPGYLAPELLSLESPCSDKADIFACAVILLEVLLPPFQTQMERSEFLEGFRTRNAVPDFLEKSLPKARALLRDMGAEDPACRLSAEEVCKKFEKEVRKELCRSNLRCCSPNVLRVDDGRRRSESGDQERDVENKRQKQKGKSRPKKGKRG